MWSTICSCNKAMSAGAKCGGYQVRKHNDSVSYEQTVQQLIVHGGQIRQVRSRERRETPKNGCVFITYIIIKFPMSLTLKHWRFTL